MAINNIIPKIYAHTHKHDHMLLSCVFVRVLNKVQTKYPVTIYSKRLSQPRTRVLPCGHTLCHVQIVLSIFWLEQSGLELAKKKHPCYNSKDSQAVKTNK